MIKVLLMVLGLLFTACTPSHEEVQLLRIGTNNWLGYEPLYLAQSKGYFSEGSIRMVRYASNTEVADAYRNGLVDAATLTLDEVMLLLQDGVKAELFLILDSSYGADAVIAQPPIDTVEKLRGLRIGVEKHAAGIYLLARMLETNGLTMADVDVLYSGYNVHQALFKSKKVDAIVTFEPIRTRLLEQGGNEIFSSRDIPGEILDVLVINPDKVRSSENLKVLASGWFKALELIRLQPDQVSVAIAAHQNIDPEKVKKGLEGIRFPSKADTCSMLGSQCGSISETLKRLEQVMLRNGLLESAGDANGSICSVIGDFLCR